MIVFVELSHSLFHFQKPKGYRKSFVACSKTKKTTQTKTTNKVHLSPDKAQVSHSLCHLTCIFLLVTIS